jgi:hypothetical protein
LSVIRAGHHQTLRNIIDRDYFDFIFKYVEFCSKVGNGITGIKERSKAIDYLGSKLAKRLQVKQFSFLCGVYLSP